MVTGLKSVFLSVLEVKRRPGRYFFDLISSQESMSLSGGSLPMFLTCRLASFGHQGLFGHRPKKCVFGCFRGQTEAGTLVF